MILQRYMNSNWLQHSFHSWAQRCQNAHSAESIEMLREVCDILCSSIHAIQSYVVQGTNLHDVLTSF